MTTPIKYILVTLHIGTVETSLKGMPHSLDFKGRSGTNRNTLCFLCQVYVYLMPAQIVITITDNNHAVIQSFSCKQL